jgi:hypothetical protein
LESITVNINKKGNKADCSIHRGILLLATTCKISSNIFLSTINVDIIIGGSSDTGDQWEYNGTVHQLIIDFKKAYDSVRIEALYLTFSFNLV